VARHWLLLLTGASCLFFLWPAAAVAHPANDAFAQATELVGDTPAVAGDNYGASKEAGEPDHAGDPGGASVWYRWTALRSGWVTVDLCQTYLPAELAVYTGGSLSSLRPVAADLPGRYCPQGSVVQFDARTGTTYDIAVDGFTDKGQEEVPENSFYLRLSLISFRPANDYFASPNALVPSPTAPNYFFSSINTTTEGANREPGEPFHAGNAGGNSVWFSWRAPLTEPTRILVCGVNPQPSPFESLLAIYTGSSLNALGEVASASDNLASAPGTGCDSPRASEAHFVAHAGDEYRIAVDGVDGSHGYFWLQLAQDGWPTTEGPATLLFRKAVRIHGRTATFKFSAPVAGARYECSLDHREFAPCSSPKTYRHLAYGRHLFEVRAIDDQGRVDRTPVRFGPFRIHRPGPARQRR